MSSANELTLVAIVMLIVIWTFLSSIDDSIEIIAQFCVSEIVDYE